VEGLPLPTEVQVKYYRAMAKSKLGINVLIVALFVVLFYALNPTSEDFQAWYSAQAQGRFPGGDESGLAGVLKKGAGAVAGAAAGIEAVGYGRSDYFVCSSYALGRERYLGVAHLFIKLK
jgi:hypothetical protein